MIVAALIIGWFALLAWLGRRPDLFAPKDDN